MAKLAPGLVAEDRAAIRVGGIALVLGVVAVFFVVAVAPRLALRRALRVRVYYSELAGLREGAPVRSAGAVIGRVESISLAPAGPPGPVSGPVSGPLSGKVGAAVLLALDPGQVARAWRGGAYVISSQGPLSARYVEIIPPPQGQALTPVSDGDQLRGVDPPTLDRVLQRTWSNLMITKQFFAAVAPEARQLRDELRTLAAQLEALRGGAGGGGPLLALSAELGALADEADRSWRDVLAGRGGAARIQAMIVRATTTWASAAAAAAALASQLEELRAEAGRVGQRLAAGAPATRLAALITQSRELADQLGAVEASARALWQRWQRREGTLGRILSDPEFPEDAKELGKILKRQPWRIVGHPE